MCPLQRLASRRERILALALALAPARGAGKLRNFGSGATAECGNRLNADLEVALPESLVRRNMQAKARPVRLKTVKGGGVRAGVDLDDSASLLDLMGS